MKPTKEIPLSEVLAALTNIERPFPSRYLPRLSDLEGANLEAFQQAWAGLPLARKRLLLKNLNDLFDEDTLLSFESLASKIIQDEDSEVRTLALRLLEETNDTRLISNLVKILKDDPNVETRARAATVLGQFIRMGELGELSEEKRDLVEGVMLKAARSEYAIVGRAALEALGYSSNPALDELIQNAFNRPDPLWQAARRESSGKR